MAIRDKFRRAVGSRKSTSSSDSSSTHCTETSTIASSVGSDTSSSKSSRARTFTFRPSKTAEEKEQQQQQQQQQKPKTKKSRTWQLPDPREKPFTELNLRYQQILGSYELSFGTTHPEQIWNPDGELSPGTSRHNSIDLERS